MQRVESPSSDENRIVSFESRIPARRDRLAWSKFHWALVIALGITWILDGIEVTLKGAVSDVLQEAATLHLTSEEIGLIASFYLTGAVVGSLFFGYLTDLMGRKKLFFITLTVPLWNSPDRLFLEPLEFLSLPVHYWLRHRRGICSHKLGYR